MCILDKNGITLGHFLYIFGYGQSHSDRKLINEPATQIELYIYDEFNGNRFETYDIDRVPLKYHHYPFQGVRKGNKMTLAFEVRSNDRIYLDSKKFQVRDFLDDIGKGYGIRLRFDRYKTYTNIYDYRDDTDVPHEYDEVYIKKIELVGDIQGISTHGAIGYKLTLECAPPWDFDPSAPLYPKGCVIIE